MGSKFVCSYQATPTFLRQRIGEKFSFYIHVSMVIMFRKGTVNENMQILIHIMGTDNKLVLCLCTAWKQFQASMCRLYD